MIKRRTIEFIESKKPICDTVTKFGGDPVWIERPQWPISKTTQKPMRFICQIAIDKELFGDISPKMAYLFITDDEKEYVDGTWEADGGENAIILQPGVNNIPVVEISKGPSLYRMVKKLFRKMLVPQQCEYLVKLTDGEDPDLIPDKDLSNLSQEAAENYTMVLQGNKIGGTPAFIQYSEFPNGTENWKLLFQIDSITAPFFVNLGDAGAGYGFIAEDGSMAKFLWQCC